MLAFIEERIDDDNEQTRIDTVASLPLAQRALAVMSRVWGDVENGGLPQFFYNRTDQRWHAWAVEAARLMAMPLTGQGAQGRSRSRRRTPDGSRTPSAGLERLLQSLGGHVRGAMWFRLLGRGAERLRAGAGPHSSEAARIWPALLRRR